MNHSDNPDSFHLFSLLPANQAAHETVHNLCGGRSKALSFRSDQIARSFPRAIAFVGHVFGIDDIVLKQGGVSGSQCYFVMTPAGDVMLCDCPATPPTILIAADGNNHPVPKYAIRWPGDNCILPMCSELTFMISFCSGELFEFRWEVELHWENVQLTRAALSRQYGWRAAKHRAKWLPFPINGRARVEPHTIMTPNIGNAPSPPLLVKETHNYRLIGQGWSGLVHHAVDIHDGGQYAVKSINMAKTKGDWNTFVAAAVQFKTEVESLAGLHHPNIIRTHHSQGWSNERTIKIFMMLCHGSATSLVTKHRCDRAIATENTKHFPQFLLDCLGALDYLHRRDLIHRDIKLANILFLRKETLLTFILSDFGVTTVQEDATGHFGDRMYTPPELADRKGKASSAADMYCFGIAILEFLGIVCRQCYYISERKWRARMRASDCTTAYKDVVFAREAHFCYARIQYLRTSGLLNTTVERMLDPDPGRRPSAEEALVELAEYYEFEVPQHIWAYSS